MVSIQKLCCSTKMKSAPSNWSNIRVFLAVVRTGSTLSASRELGVAQPTVARRIDEFEQELGLILFERDTRGFHLTPQGGKLVKDAEKVEAAVRSLGATAAELANDAFRIIRFSAPIAALSDEIYEVITEFRDAHPDTPVEVTPTNQFLDLMGGEGDIALRITPQIKEENLICRKLGVLSGGIYASRSYSGPLPSEQDRLSGYKFAVFEGQNVPHTLNNWLLEQIRPEQVAAKCSDLGSMVATIGNGELLGPLPRPLGDRSEKLTSCFYAPDSLSVPVWLVISPAAYQRKIVRALVKLMAKRYRSLGW